MRSRHLPPGCLQAALGLMALAYIASLWLLPQSNPTIGLLFVLGLSAVSGIYTFVVSLPPTLPPPQRLSELTAGVRPNTGEEAQAPQSIAAWAVEAKAHAVEAPGTIEGHAGREMDAVSISKAQLPPGMAALHQLPAPPAGFAGRDLELHALRAAAQQTGTTVLGLSGPGGVGKTALALALANVLAADYPDAQFFIDLQGNTGALTRAAGLRQVIHAYRPLDKLPSNPAEMQAAYRNVLHGQRALIVFDNAQGREQASLLPPPPRCLMLVTSREYFTLPGAYMVALGSLSLEAAVALLLRLAPRIGERAAELAEVCGRLPLALRLAGGTLAEREDVNPAEYASRLQAEQNSLTVPNEAEASLAVSYGLLTPEQQRHWRQLAVSPAGFDRPAAAAVWALDGDSAEPALGELLAYGLLAYDHRLERYRLHDLARLAADARLKAPQRDEAQQRHAAYYGQVLAAADQLWLKGGDDTTRGLRLFDREQSYVLAGQAWAAERAGQDDAMAKLASDYLVAGANVLALRQQPPERIAWLIAARTAAQRLGDRKAEGVHLAKLGSAHRHLGQTAKAIAYYELCLQIARQIGDQHGEGTALGNLGLTYADLGSTRRAVAYYEQQLDISRRIGDRRDEARASWNLGLARQELGEMTEAIAAMQVCVDFEREVGHPDAEQDAALLDQLRARLRAGDK